MELQSWRGGKQKKTLNTREPDRKVVIKKINNQMLCHPGPITGALPY